MSPQSGAHRIYYLGVSELLAVSTTIFREWIINLGSESLQASKQGDDNCIKEKISLYYLLIYYYYSDYNSSWIAKSEFLQLVINCCY